MRDAMIGYGHNMTYSKFRYGGSAVQVTEEGICSNNIFHAHICQAIFVDPKTGKIEANADYRKRGTVDGF